MGALHSRDRKAVQFSLFIPLSPNNAGNKWLDRGHLMPAMRRIPEGTEDCVQKGAQREQPDLK